ncbi:MAG: LysM peptidoglycan-binding domain-containing protein [Patescibacteria group bacterium]|nr:LysM peptidoglycan-binding domain-containing protein [Patescibacteria group bacterium]
MPKAQKINKINKSDVVSKSVARNSVFSKVKWGESYTSLFLGIVVVVVAAVLVFSFLKGKNFNRTSSTQSTSASQEQQANKPLPKTYLVKQGDDLWSISEKIYGSGYNWVDLVEVNKIENPELLYVGIKLTVPDVKAKLATGSKTVAQNVNAITGTSYTVTKGDYLWEIAIRAYGDGFKWVEIAKANKLVNPNLIHSGNVLKLPR